LRTNLVTMKIFPLRTNLVIMKICPLTTNLVIMKNFFFHWELILLL
jgi:hypothetical protein